MASLTGASNLEGHGRHLTTELFPEKVHEMGPSHGVFQEFPEAEAPLFYTELRGRSHTGGEDGCVSMRSVGWVGRLRRTPADPLAHPWLTWVHSWPSRCHHL